MYASHRVTDLSRNYPIYKNHAITIEKVKRKNLFNHIFLLGFILFIISSYTISSFSINNENSTITTTESYLIKPGDTLWTIAMTFKGAEEDPRDYIANIIRINELDSSTIYVGENIEIYLGK